MTLCVLHNTFRVVIWAMLVVEAGVDELVRGEFPQVFPVFQTIGGDYTCLLGNQAESEHSPIRSPLVTHGNVLVSQGNDDVLAVSVFF